MRRRDVIGLAACVQPPPPVDEVKMNRFAAEWNEFVEKLKLGIIDLKQWARVVKAWERL